MPGHCFAPLIQIELGLLSSARIMGILLPSSGAGIVEPLFMVSDAVFSSSGGYKPWRNAVAALRWTCSAGAEA